MSIGSGSSMAGISKSRGNGILFTSDVCAVMAGIVGVSMMSVNEMRFCARINVERISIGTSSGIIGSVVWGSSAAFSVTDSVAGSGLCKKDGSGIDRDIKGFLLRIIIHVVDM